MTVIGLIAEFNPLHNGHLYFIEKIKKDFSNPYIIGIISSNFVQRGEPAILDKWTRTSLALEAGVNLVLELPFVFACQNAEVFSKGALSILRNFPIDYLAFGAENDSSDLKDITKKLLNVDEDLKFSNILKKNLSLGHSYIRSRNRALVESDILNKDEIEIISKPNNILAVEYIKALDYFNLDICPYSIKRKYVDHDSPLVVSDFASGSFIRNNFDKNSSKLAKYLPGFTANSLSTRSRINDQILYGLIKYKLTFTNNIALTTDYEEGLDNRLKKNIDKARSLDELAHICASQRLTKSRIKRAIVNALVGYEKYDSKKLFSSNYIRVLGSDDLGFELLKSSDKKRINSFKEIDSSTGGIHKIGSIELRASNLYSIITSQDLNMDYYKSVIIK